MRDFFDLVTVFLSYVVSLLFIALVAGLPVMWLWNWLMPVLFKLPQINFWQSLGILVLTHCIFPGVSVSSSKN